MRLTAHAEWSPGYSFSATDLRDTLWIFGHRDGNSYSPNGRSWRKDTLGAANASAHNAYVVLGGAIYAIGGAESQTRPTRKAVWKSTDGRHWQLLTDHPAWSARVWHTAVVHDSRIWLIGGFDGAYRNDIWSSSDGINWQLATPNAPFFRSNDVWSSRNGASWTPRGHANWSPRFSLASTVFRDRVWVLGGKEGGGAFTNDVWFLDTLTR